MVAIRSVESGPIRVISTTATRVIAICGKCGKKIDGGFGGDASQPLGKLLRRTVGDAKGKRATLRIVETKCLDVCPKGAVALLDSTQPGAVVIVARATPAAVVLARLGLGE